MEIKQQFLNFIQKCIGSILFIPVEHYQTFYDLKTNILKELKLNSTRFYEDQFIIYDIEKEKDSLNRQISLDNEYVWDILNKWDSTLCKKKVKLDEDFFQFFMIKSLLPFEIKGEDPIPTMFNFSQIFYEVYTIYTNYIVELEKTIKMLAFLQNVIKDEDISKEMPIYFTDQQRNQILPEVQKIYFKIKDKYSVIQSKINYLEIAKDSIFYDATEISVQYSFAQNDKDFESTSIVLKPTSFLVLSQDQLSHKQYFYKDIQQISHNNNKKTLIKMKDESTHYIMSDKSFQIEFLIQKYQNLISNNQLNSFDHNSLKEIKME